MAEIWVTSDTHYGHENIIKFSNRPFHDVKHMDNMMVDRWNSVVKPEDKVYHLGDVYFGSNPPLDRLQGKKRLILGNHDNGKDQLLQRHFQKIEVWRMFKEFGLLLTHVPVHPASLERIHRKQVWDNGSQKYELEEEIIPLKNIHGHTHLNAEPHGDKKNYKCVCVELTDYTPVNIEELRVR